MVANIGVRGVRERVEKVGQPLSCATYTLYSDPRLHHSRSSIVGEKKKKETGKIYANCEVPLSLKDKMDNLGPSLCNCLVYLKKKI